MLDLAPADAARVAVEARDDGAVRGDAAAIGIVVAGVLAGLAIKVVRIAASFAALGGGAA